MKKRVLSLFLAITLCLSLTPTGALAEKSQPEQTVAATQETETPTPAPQKEEPQPGQTVAATQETETPTPAPQKEEPLPEPTVAATQETETPTPAPQKEESLPEPTVAATQETETPTPAPQKEESLPEPTVAATQETETPTPAPQKEESTAPAENGADENASPASPDEKPTENTPAAAEKNTADEEPGKEPAAATGKDESKADGSPSDDDAAKVQNRLVMAAAAEPGVPTMMGQNEPLALNDAEQNGEGGGIYVAPGSPTEGGGTYIPGEDTRTEIWCTSKPSLIQRGYDGTTDGSTIPFSMTFTDNGTNKIELTEGTDFTATKTFDSADAGSRTVTVEIELIGDAAAKYKLKAGQETFTIGGYIDKAHPDLNVSLSKTTCTVGEKILPLLSVSGVQENAAVTYYYAPLDSGYLEFEGSNAVPAIDENTAISSFDEEGNNTYYVYAKTAETKNYKEERSATVALTVTELAAASVTKADGTVSGTYKTLPAALDAAQDGDTVKLLADHTTKWSDVEAGEYATLAVVKKTLTLDLNGMTVDYLTVGDVVPDEAGGILESYNGNLTVADSAQGGSCGKIKDLEFVKGSLAIQGGRIGDSLTCDGNSGTVTISGGTVCNATVGEGATVNVNGGTGHAGTWFNDGTLNITGGTFGDVLFLNNGGTIAISGGTFGTITNINGSSSIPLMPLLADNYAFYQGDNAQNSTVKTLTNVTVRSHTHSVENGKCDCGASYVASVTSDAQSTNYTSLDDALNAAQNGDTVTLLGDAEVTKWHFLSKAFTLELNGKTATTQSNAELYLHARVIVQDSSTGKTGGMAGTALLNVQDDGDLTIQSGTFNGRITINVGKLTIKGGTFNQEVDLRGGDSDSVFFSGGTFAKIWYPNSSGSFLDLLADGYAFYDKNGKLVNAAKITDTNLYNVRIRPHQHTFTNGACACGYTCPHTSVDESGACTVCGKQFAASITEGDDVTYYDTFNGALVYAYNNDGCTLKLLADVTEAAVMINNPFLFDLNGHNVGALSVDARATIKDSGTKKGKIGKVTVSTHKVTDLTLGDLLEEGYAFQYENGYWANDSHLQTSDGLSVTVEKAPIQSVAVYAKDKNNKEVSTTIAYGTTGEVTLVSSCRMGETSGADLSYLWYKLEGLAATAPLEGATGANYTLPDNLTAGTHTYLLICTSDGYSKSAEITITVTPISLEGAEVTVENPTYNGQEQSPAVTVKLGEKTLTRGTDFYVDATMQTNVGSYTLTVTGKGNYTGKIENVNWKIEPMQLYRFCNIEPVTKVYDGTAVAPLSEDAVTFNSRNASKLSLPKGAYSITNARFTMKQTDGSYADSPEVGNGKLLSFTVTLTSDNYVFESTTEDSKTIVCDIATDDVNRFTITKAAAPTNIPSGTLNIINGTKQTYTYDFSKLLPELSEGEYGTVSYGNRAAISVVPQSGYYYDDLLVEFNNGVLTLVQFCAEEGTMTDQIGTVNVTVTTTNYNNFRLTLVLNAVNQIKPTPDGTISASEITYGQALSDSAITGTMKDPNTGATVNGTFAWKDGTTTPAANDRYEAEWTFTPDAPEYATATGTVTIKVDKATPAFTAPTAQENLTYTGQEQALITAGSVTDYGTMQYSLTENGTYSQDIPTGTDAGTYTVWYRVIGDANHNDTEPASVVVSIGKKPLRITGVTAASKTYDGTTNADITSVTFDNVILNRDTDYNVTASFDDASVGNDKNITATVTLTEQGAKNYALEQNCFFASGSITKAAAPGSDFHPAVTVINDLAKTYEMVLSNDYLPELSSPCEYGNVSYSLGGTQLTNGYTDKVQAEVVEENGQYKLKLTVPAVDYNKVSSVGTLWLYVSSVNYQNFRLDIGVRTKNKDVPVPDGTISASDITYGQALNDSKIAGKMKAGGNAIVGTFTWTNDTFKPDAGSYDAEWVFTPAEGYEEYATATGVVTVTVNPKAVTVSGITAKDKVYDGNTNAVLDYSKVTLDGVLENDTLTVTATGTFEKADIGKQKVTISDFKLSGASAANYVPSTEDSQTETTATITAKEATVTPDNKTKAYEEKDPDLTYAVSGVLDGETLKGITLTRAEGENAGEYAITGTADAGANPNYEVTFAEGKFTIDPKSIDGATVVLGKGLIANGAEQTQTVEKVLLDGKELPADSYTVTDNTATAPGKYTLTITAKGNYTDSVEQTYAIAPAKAEDAPSGSGKVNVDVQSEGAVPPAALLTDKAELPAMLVDSGDITAEELAQIADGASVDIVLTVKEANVSDEVKAAMAQAAKGSTIGHYLDISLFKYMTVNGSQQAGVALHTTRDALTISVVVPDALINTNSAVIRTYYIVRNHEGTITVLDAAFDAANKTLTFKTDRFSDYAIAYKDTAVPSSGSNPGSNSGSSNSSNDSETKKNEVTAPTPTPTPTPASTSKPSTITAAPQTGDTFHPTLYVVLLVASLLGLAVVFVCKKRNDK